MIAASVQGDVDGIPKGSHYIKYKGLRRSTAVASACRSYGCTMNILLLVSVPFVVLTVIGPVVAPSGIVALINVE